MMSQIRPKRSVSQAPLKATNCHSGCGAIVHFRTNPRVYCEPCKIDKVKADARASMEKQRRKRGVQEVKGVTIRCDACRCEVILDRNPRARFCRDCYLATNGLDARRRSAKRRATQEGRDAYNAWSRERRLANPHLGVASHIKTLMHRALGKRKAGKSWRTFVPYTLDELMLHLERQFLPGMTWANRGKWHIDHIRPLASFNYNSPADPDFQAAWSLSNLRPLWAVDNVRKNATRTHLL